MSARSEQKLTIKQIKKKMLKWKDFFGGDIMYDIEGAKTKKELAEIMDIYFHHLEDTCNYALRHCENFKHELGLNWY